MVLESKSRSNLWHRFVIYDEERRNGGNKKDIKAWAEGFLGEESNLSHTKIKIRP